MNVDIIKMVTEEDIRNYIQHWYKIIALNYLNPKHHDKFWFEYIIIERPNGVMHFYPIINSSYAKVYKHLDLCLMSHFENKFGIKYKSDYDFKCMLTTYDEPRAIDPNYTEAVFKINNQTSAPAKKVGTYIEFSVGVNIHNIMGDKNSNDPLLPPARYRNMVYKYFDITPEEFEAHQSDYALPEEIMVNLSEFRQLYEDTFGEVWGEKYKIYCSRGLTRM